MKTLFAVLTVAALLVIAAGLPGYAEGATASKTPPAPTATQTGAPPASVPRRSLTPKAAEPASLPAAAGPAPNSDRRPARRYFRFGHYRIAYRKPFSIHRPHFHRHRINWRRIS
jgi:zona occludens toxin (predicted ATPase)